jgi:hypothetical protein
MQAWHYTTQEPVWLMMLRNKEGNDLFVTSLEAYDLYNLFQLRLLKH